MKATDISVATYTKDGEEKQHVVVNFDDRASEVHLHNPHETLAEFIEDLKSQDKNDVLSRVKLNDGDFGLYATIAPKANEAIW